MPDPQSINPWLTLGQLRDDLRQARALLRRKPRKSITNDDARALIALERALARIGDGARDDSNA